MAVMFTDVVMKLERLAPVNVINVISILLVILTQGFAKMKLKRGDFI